jgi:membrane associated rhomboid family serine protease
MADQTCYRHPDRETGVSCSSCGRPICPECMTPTPVGMRCPECASQRTRVHRGSGTPSGFAASPATYVLIALNAIAFVAEIAGGSGGFDMTGNPVVNDFGLRGVDVAAGEWYRILTAGFLHGSLIHIGFNMFALYFLGRLLEPGIGTPRFVAIYFASLLAGSFGALALSDPGTVTVGASGAIFGIFGATFLIARGRGLNEIATELGILLAINLALTFGISNISIGGHLGGLVGGLLCGLIVVAGERGRFGAPPNRLRLELAAIAAVGVLSVVGALAIA